MISVNNLITNALSIIDVNGVDFSRVTAAWQSVAVDMVNGMIGEFEISGIMNPLRSVYELNYGAGITEAGDQAQYITCGQPDYTLTIPNQNWIAQNSNKLNIPTLFTAIPGFTNALIVNSTCNNGEPYNVMFNVVCTAGSLVVSFDGNTIATIAVGTTNYGKKLTPFYDNPLLTFTPSNTFAGYINGIYIGGDIPYTFSEITSLQFDLGSITYNLTKISIDEYYSMSIKQNIGSPCFWAWSNQYPMSRIYIYPGPMGGMTLRVIGSKKLSVLTSSQTYLDIDSMYYNALLWSLAENLYPYFKKETGMDPAIAKRASGARAGMRSKGISMRMQKAKVPYNPSSNGSSYWTSPLNTVNR